MASSYGLEQIEDRVLNGALTDHRNERASLVDVDTIARCAAEIVLHRLHRGVIIVDSDSHLLFANSVARAVLARSDVVRLGPDERIWVIDQAMQQRFVGYLRTARDAVHRTRPASSPNDRISIPDDFAARAGGYRLFVAPLLEQSLNVHLNGSAPLHLMFLYEPNERHHLATNTLRQMYALSAAEARVVVMLFEGHAPSEVACELHISMNTIRTHLKRIFEKCSVRSQAELLQLLALGPVTL